MQSGLYDDFINELLERQLDQLPQEAQKELALAEAEEIPLLLSRYLKTLFEAFLSRQDPSFLKGAPPLDLANAFIASLARVDDSLLAYQLPKPPLRLLKGLAKPGHTPYQQVADAKSFSLIRPDSPMAYSSLFTGSRHEPALYSEFKKELASCDRADFLVSFLRWSGVRLIYEDLKRFTDLGGELRVLTTSYMGATDPKAVDALASLKGTTLRISYDTKNTRLHAKAYIFHRNSGLSCAYIGSSNLSRAATTTGSEWNVKVCAKDSAHMLEKISATFATYWNAPSYETYDATQKQRLEQALAQEKSAPAASPIFFDLHPYAFQQDILDQIQAERTVFGRWKNLVVSATGTGKTMIAAFDFREVRRKNPSATFLFLAHREEILRRSREAFRGVLKDENFGDLWVGGEVPSDPRSLFLSVQMAAAKNITRHFPKDFFDYIVVDEFHHASAATYADLLQHFTPKILLGLTATPERMDGEDILVFFGGHMACELRLPEAIAQNLLCPFQYFGVADPADLSHLKWTRGGYEGSELTELYVFSREIAKKRADYIVRALDRTVTDLAQTKALAFCVSKEHARFMAEHFQASGLKALALTADTPAALRQSARKDLEQGRLNILCVVDLYNEGVDIPAINTLLFLRPTQSLTIFLQQLGRGLRHSPGKDCLTVLDFIGQQHKNYAFSEKFSALLHRKGRSLSREMKEGFPGLPPNCYIQLEKVPAQILEANLRQVVGRQSYLQQLIQEAAHDVGPECSLEEFLAYWAHQGKTLSPRDIYRYKRSFMILSAS